MFPRAAVGGLLLSLTLAITKGNLYEGHSLGTPCLPSHVCTLAFVSDNPLVLRCPHALRRVFWHYHSPARNDDEVLTFSLSRSSLSPALRKAHLRRLQFKSRLFANKLYIPSPSVQDSGVYTCRIGDAVLAYYQVDVQDAESICVSHASLGETTLGNATADLGNGTQAKLFTSWSPWQPCDRCGPPGERKRVGFCYAQVIAAKDRHMEMLLPCGMARRKHPMLPKRGPELRVEACQAPCNKPSLLTKGEPNTMPVLVYNTYHPDFQDTIYLRCPTSSIYSPVYWQEGPTKLTRLQLLQRNSSSESLDEATGGGILLLTFHNESRRTSYQCYVNGHLTGKFVVTFPSTFSPAGQFTHTYNIIEVLVVGLSLFLVFLMFLSIFQSCRRKQGASLV